MKVICETCGSDLNQHGQCPACLREESEPVGEEDSEDANEGAHDDNEEPWDDSWDD